MAGKRACYRALRADDGAGQLDSYRRRSRRSPCLAAALDLLAEVARGEFRHLLVAGASAHRRGPLGVCRHRHRLPQEREAPPLPMAWRGGDWRRSRADCGARQQEERMEKMTRGAHCKMGKMGILSSC